MERYIGMDMHAASCTLAVISEKGRQLKDFPVETNGQALVEAIRMIPGHKHLVMEEGLQSAWLYETLSPHVDELVVAGITQSSTPRGTRRSCTTAPPVLARGPSRPACDGELPPAGTGFEWRSHTCIRRPMSSQLSNSSSFQTLFAPTHTITSRGCG